MDTPLDFSRRFAMGLPHILPSTNTIAHFERRLVLETLLAPPGLVRQEAHSLTWSLVLGGMMSLSLFVRIFHRSMCIVFFSFVGTCILALSFPHT